MQYEDYVTSRNPASALTGDEVFIFLQGGGAVEGSLNDLIDFIIDTVGAGVEHYRGDYAGTTSVPSTGGNYTGGAPAKADRWRLTDYLTFDGSGPFQPGTIIEAAVDGASNTRADWNIYSMLL